MAAQPTRLVKPGGFIQHLTWSPDGKKFLFTRIHAGKMGLWTVNIDGSELTQLLPKANTPHFDGAWSPDSKRIIFVYDILQGTDGKLQLDVMNADGSGQKNLVPHKNFFEESPRYSPDGEKIIWTSTRKKPDIDHEYDGKNMKAATTDRRSTMPDMVARRKLIAFTMLALAT